MGIHLNKTKQNKAKHQLRKNPQATQEAWGLGRRTFQGPKLLMHRPLKRFLPNAETLVKCKKGILALHGIPESSLSLFFWKVKACQKAAKGQSHNTSVVWAKHRQTVLVCFVFLAQIQDTLRKKKSNQGTLSGCALRDPPELPNLPFALGKGVQLVVRVAPAS